MEGAGILVFMQILSWKFGEIKVFLYLCTAVPAIPLPDSVLVKNPGFLFIACHEARDRHYQRGFSVFPSNPALKSLTSEVTVAIRHISQRGEMVSPDKIVAELTFGFWVTLLNSEYELTLWKGLRLALPYMPKKDRKRKNVSSPCNALRKLRNRVFHHESICWDLDYIMGIHSRLVQVLGWMNQDMPVWLEEVDNFHIVVDSIRNSSAGLKLWTIILLPKETWVVSLYSCLFVINYGI